MALRRGAIVINLKELTVPLKVGDTVPCPVCPHRHFVMQDSREGRKFDTETGLWSAVSSDGQPLFIECPEEPGPIIVGLNGLALKEPFALTPRRKGN